MTKQTFTVGQVLTAAEMTSLQQTAMGGGSTTAKTASYVLVAADAGTVVQMNAAGATTITVNTALFAAGDTVQIQNVGAGVCTVTAGTATVSTAGSLALSQYEGGQLYFNTTSAALFFDIVQTSGMTNPLTTTGDTIYSSSGTTPARLGIGSSGQVLTVASGLPSWATASSGLTLINTTTFSGASSVAVDSVLTSTYPNYFIQTNFTSATGTDQMVKLRVRAGGTAYTGGDYDTIGNRSYLGAVIGFGGFATAWELHNITASSGGHSHNTIQLLSPQTASVETKITSFGFGYTSVTYTTNSIHMSGYLQNSAQYDGFIMFVTTGDIAGTVKIYGYAN